MARIADTEIQRLKAEISIERLVEVRGIQLRRHGAELIGLCPFHDDREPSLVITPSKNLWHCLGACQAGGSVIDWVMRAEGVSFRHAVELLREMPSLAATAGAAPVKHATVPKLPSPVERDADDRALLLQVVDYYHQTLLESPEALAYLESRGLNSPEMVGRFRLGFANRTLGYRLPARNRKSGAEMRGRLEQLGILRCSGHEHFNGSVVIPIFDEQGQVVEMYGRKITPGLRPGTPLHLYLPGAHRGVWNWEAFQAGPEIILCEALLDALTFWVAGFRNVTSSYGVEGFTSAHLEAFKRYGTKRVLIAYDRDDAGEKAAATLAERLLTEGLEVYRIQFPRGMDANEYALKVQPAVRSLGLTIRKAVWLGQGTAPAAAGGQAPIVEGPGPEIAAAAKEEKITAANLDSGQQSSTEEPLPLLAAAAAAKLDIAAEVKAEEVIITLGDRRYRIRGLQKNLSYDMLKINLLAARGEGFHVDTLDLYSARQRAVFVKQTAEELGVEEEVIKRDLGKVLLKLEQLQEELIRKALQPREESVALSEAEKAIALQLLRDPQLLDRILTDFARCGVVGEETNKLVGYLAAVSRKLEEPLAVILQSSTAAGKTSLMEAVLAFVPEEDRVQYSAMTGQSLFYMSETNLQHKVLAIVEEEGAERAAYALKLLQSEGQLTIASTGKDPATGRLVTHEYRVEGPVMIFLTTTAIDIDEELLNRCLVLTVDEDREQTRAIHRSQRQAQTIEGLLSRQTRQSVLKVHRDAQRLLKPLLVANPYARELTFLDHQTRTRRDHLKYLTLIRTIALLRQYQRPMKSIMHGGQTIEYIEVTLDDIETANRLAHEILGRSLDELAPQTRRLLVLVDEMVSEQCRRLNMERSDFRFSRRDVRNDTGWGDTQLRVHLRRLEELEYLLVHHGGRGQSFVYELLYEAQGQDGRCLLPGLIDVAKLSGPQDEKNAGQREQSAPIKRGQNGPLAGGLRTAETPVPSGLRAVLANNLKKTTYPASGENPVVVVTAGGR